MRSSQRTAAAAHRQPEHQQHHEQQEPRNSWLLQFDLKEILQPRKLRALLEDSVGTNAEAQSYQILMPVARKLVAVYKQKQRQTECPREPKIPCILCRDRASFRGWPAFMIHQEKYWKSHPHHHRGYFRALKEVLIAEGLVSHPSKPQTWPPILLVDNSGPTFDGSLRRWRGLQGEKIPSCLKDLNLEEILAVYSQGKDHDGKNVIVFPPSEVGMIDAHQLDLHLKKCEQGKADWVRLNNAKGSQLPDLDTTNPLNYQSSWEDSTHFICKAEEIDHPAACNSDNLAEFLGKKHTKILMDRWSESFQESNKLVAFTLPRPFRKSKELREMDSKFMKDLKDLGLQNPRNKEFVRIQLEEIEKRLRKERLAWLKEIDDVEEQLDATSRDLQEQRASEEFENEISEMQKEKTAQRQCDERVKKKKKDMKDLSCIHCNEILRKLVKAEERRPVLIAAYQEEEDCFRRQAELARDKKRHVQKIACSSSCRD